LLINPKKSTSEEIQIYKHYISNMNSQKGVRFDPKLNNQQQQQ